RDRESWGGLAADFALWSPRSGGGSVGRGSPGVHHVRLSGGEPALRNLLAHDYLEADGGSGLHDGLSRPGHHSRGYPDRLLGNPCLSGGARCVGGVGVGRGSSIQRKIPSAASAQNGRGELKYRPMAQRERLRVALVSVSFGEYCMRSEEHTSELQSRFDLVCRLLLE